MQGMERCDPVVIIPEAKFRSHRSTPARAFVLLPSITLRQRHDRTFSGGPGRTGGTRREAGIPEDVDLFLIRQAGSMAAARARVGTRIRGARAQGRAHIPSQRGRAAGGHPRVAGFTVRRRGPALYNCRGRGDTGFR